MALYRGKELWFICHTRDQALRLLLHGAGGCAVVQVWLARAQSIHTTPTLVFNNARMTGHSLFPRALSCRPKTEKYGLRMRIAGIVACSTEIEGCGLRVR